LGLCDIPSGDPNQPFIHVHDGRCTPVEVYLIDTQASALRQGISIYAGEAPAAGSLQLHFNPLQGLEGAANFIEGFGNAELGTVDTLVHYGSFGTLNPNLHINQLPFESCNPTVVSDYQAGQNVGTIYGFIPGNPAADLVTVSIYTGIFRNLLSGG
jgi:hypothetical protein